MTRLEMLKLIHKLHTYMREEKYNEINSLLNNVNHENKQRSLCLLRSSFANKDKYLYKWNKQRSYAIELFGIEHEEVLKGLL